MLATPTVQYALRALASLARLPEGDSIFARDLAARTSVPASYLSKILNTLGRAGLVEGTRGTRGGYRLARPAADIPLRDVFEALDPHALAQVCFLRSGTECSEHDACPIHERWSRIRNELLTFVSSSTVDDLAPRWGSTAAPDRMPAASEQRIDESRQQRPAVAEAPSR
ncbi:MAG TPA: Rrf2 family transcriptional regulator [Thermoanaerobaculia bacterium]|nr:Rrf2 family transcriptional regulator [Thermoanaerobaculia bacterium]